LLVPSFTFGSFLMIGFWIYHEGHEGKTLRTSKTKKPRPEGEAM